VGESTIEGIIPRGRIQEGEEHIKAI